MVSFPFYTRYRIKFWHCAQLLYASVTTGLLQLYQNRAKENRGIVSDGTATSPTPKTQIPRETEGLAQSSRPEASYNSSDAFAKPGNPYSRKAASTVANPYAKKTPVVNPYARKPEANQNANSAGVNPYAKSAADSSASSGKMMSPADQNSLWVDKHAPQATRDILGNKENIQKLSSCECFCVPCTWCWIANNFRFTHISNLLLFRKRAC